MSLTGRNAYRYPLFSLKSQTSNLQGAGSAALESRPPSGFAISSVALRRGIGLGCRDGLERPAYAQMPLRGNENVQTPEQRRLALPSCSSCVLLNSPAHKQTEGSEKSRLISTQPP